MQPAHPAYIQVLPLLRNPLHARFQDPPSAVAEFSCRRSSSVMNETDRKTNAAIRQDVRFPQLCELSMIYEGATEDVSVRPPDLSPHGMFINTRTDYPEGAVLKLRFRLSRTGVLVQTRCEVRYCLKGVGIGVEFVDVTPETTRAIDEEISVQLTSK